MISEAINLYNSLVSRQSSSFESKFEPLPVTWQPLRRLFHKVTKGLEGEINGQALGAALQHCLGGSDGRAQTQGLSESAAVAAGRDQLA